jgi:2-keto-4-pentenoate hydratase/2-oxohepta-3-ene-1,7-dioic acid hydratase in catechol pathway
MRVCRVEVEGRSWFAEAAERDAFELLTGAPWLGATRLGRTVAQNDARLLAPVAPSKVVCVGHNYAAHANELGVSIPGEPLLFLKAPSALIGPRDAIVRAPESERVDYEGEVAIVIGRRIKNADEDAVRAAIFGVTCINDVTARDLQKKDVQFTRAKSFDTFCPMGPWIETAAPLEELTVTSRVNGLVRQHAPVSHMIFSITKLVSYISRCMTLEPGDVVATGTPEGVGPLVAGDEVEVEVSGVGILRNRVVDAA